MSGAVRLLYRFNPDVQSIKRSGNRITLEVKDWRPVGFTAAATSHADAIMALADGATLSQLDEIAAASGDAEPASKAMRYYIDRFAYARMLAWSLLDDKGELASVQALAKRYKPKLGVAPDDDLVLCRFAFVRQLGGQATMESGLVRARVGWRPRGLDRLAGILAHPHQAVPGSLAEALWRLGFLDTTEPERNGAHRCWEFHDLLMHETSRANRDITPVGGTYRFDGMFPPLPAIKPAVAGRRIELGKVDPARIRQQSKSIDSLQAARCSIRDYAEAAVSLSSLSEFLWRVCRTTAHIRDERQDVIVRPYPAGGSINELEFYVAAHRCDGLEPAVYHYDSHGHALVQLDASARAAQKIIEGAVKALVLKSGQLPPALTIVVTTRLPRLAWKYQGMAYRATLMNVGVVYHLMYMVATDMGLGPCAIGTADSRLLEDVAGLDRLEETAIAEFALGIPAVAGNTAQ
jgi:SagB-type dehydrogenase family enzyme